MQINIKPPLFTNADLRAIAQSCPNRSHPIAAVVNLLRSIRQWRFEDVKGEGAIALQLVNLAIRFDMEASFLLWTLLLELGAIAGDVLDLEKLSEQCQEVRSDGQEHN